MPHINDTEILIAAIFGVWGFVTGYFLKRGLNFFIFGIFLYAAFKGLEKLKYAPDWKNFDSFVTILQQLGKVMLSLMNNMLSTAGILSIFLFLCGGIMGLILSRRRIWWIR